ncbi:hypothetical protein [Microbacterium plantarum]|uniref:hypothetical protein n=1 Tax=Microbacterium plantarum TaxID=1816425 RepID=UPI002B4A7D0C|nr:hypothetical protein [Microbacterium plantarum]WRK16153.1 hypothetical protein VC184_09485 [Microbacterium plantarum]
MTIDLTTTPELPAPVPARGGEGVDVRVSRDDEVLARVALASLAGFGAAVLMLLVFGISAIS